MTGGKSITIINTIRATAMINLSKEIVKLSIFFVYLSIREIVKLSIYSSTKHRIKLSNCPYCHHVRWVTGGFLLHILHRFVCFE